MRDVDWRMCLRCMSEGEDGRPMVAPMFIAGSAIENLGAGIAHPTIPSSKSSIFDTSLYTREAIRCGGMRADRGVRPYKNVVIEKWKGER